jgi:hypothetical protein
MPHSFTVDCTQAVQYCCKCCSVLAAILRPSMLYILLVYNLLHQCTSCLHSLSTAAAAAAPQQMYTDAFTPDMYWRYTHKWAPSSNEIIDWLNTSTNNSDAADPSSSSSSSSASSVSATSTSATTASTGSSPTLSTPVSLRAPLPSAVACLAMMPLEGQHLVPEQLRSLMTDSSSAAAAMYRAPGAPRVRFNVEVLLSAVAEHAPEVRHTACMCSQLDGCFMSPHSSVAFVVPRKVCIVVQYMHPRCFMFACVERSEL